MSEHDPSDDPNGPDEQPEGEEPADDNYEPQFLPGSSTLGDAARQRRELLGLTQEDVAERFGGPSVASLRTIENGQSASYRAKTLFSLDTALAWPSGASITLLSGRMDRLRTQHGDGWNFDFLNDEPWGSTFRISGPSLKSWEYDNLVRHLISHISDGVAKKYDVPILSASPPRQREPDPPRQRQPDASEQIQHSARDEDGDPSPPPSLTDLLDEEYERHPPVIHENEKYNKVLLAMSSLDANELEDLGRFAINMARMTRLMEMNRKTDRTRALQEFRESEQRAKSKLDSDFDFASEEGDQNG